MFDHKIPENSQSATYAWKDSDHFVDIFFVSLQGDSRICFGKYGDVGISEYRDEHSTTSNSQSSNMQQSTGHGKLSLQLNKGGEDIWIENSKSFVYVKWWISNGTRLFAFVLSSKTYGGVWSTAVLRNRIHILGCFQQMQVKTPSNTPFLHCLLLITPDAFVGW